MIKMERYHWQHYFGGVALLFLFLQVVTGVVLAQFYQPHLKEAYASVQYLYNIFTPGIWFRELHRWGAGILLMTVVIHSVRSLLRKDYEHADGRVLWVTGSLLLLPLLALLATGFILPWEWRAYWFMEMIPNYFGYLPVVGESIKTFLIDAFTMNRAFVAHVVFLPIITLILVDYHILNKTRKKKGGLIRYLLRHAMLATPFFILVTLLVLFVPTPTQDPDILPMPLDGTYIPTPEWFLLIFWVPFLHMSESLSPWFGFFLPFLLFVLLTMMPFFKKEVEKRALSRVHPVVVDNWQVRVMSGGILFVTICILMGLLYAGNYRSPTLGCNACHNIAMGTRMGIPPDAFKDRGIVPLLDNDKWMVDHWYYPQKVW